MNLQDVLIQALKETLYMVSVSALFAVIIGFALALMLILTDEKGLKPNKLIYSVLDFIINIFRSVPFIILLVVIVPFTKLIVGKSIGTTAAIVPLTVAAAPFAARVIESAFKDVDYGVIEAAKSFGANTFQILFKVMFKEAMPQIILGITLIIINLIAYSAMAGAVGAGGLGDVAIKYGYYRFRTDISLYTVLILIILVQVLQSLGNYIYKKQTKN